MKSLFLVTLTLCTASFAGSDDAIRQARKVFDEGFGKSLTSKVSVKRGANVLSLDLANAEDVAKIKAGETIQLEEGRYSNLGGLKLKGLKFVGKGADKTFLSTNLKTEIAPPILTNQFEFWDLTIMNTNFQQPAGDKIWAVGVRLAGDNYNLQPQWRSNLEELVLILSHAGATDTLSDKTLRLFSYTHLSTAQELRGLKDFQELDNFVMMGCYSKQACPGVPEGSDGTVLQLVPKAKQNLSELKIDPKKKAYYLEAVSKFQTYVVAHSAGKIPAVAADETTSPEYRRLLTKAESALKRKRDFAALLYLDAANKLTSSANESEITPKMAEINERLRKELGCHFSADGQGNFAAYKEALQTQISEESPLVAMGGEDSKCLVKLTNYEQSGQAVATDGKILKREAVYEETEETKQKRLAESQAAWAAKQAAEKAADRARQLRVDAATEKMTDTARKMEAGRVKVEGNQITYGSGNWNGQASVGTQAALDRAESQAKGGAAAPGAAGDAKYVKVGENLTLQGQTSQQSSQTTKAWVEVQGNKPQEVSGPTLTITSTRDCVLKRGHTGAYEDAAECQAWKRVGGMFPQDYVKTHLYKPVMIAIGDKLIKSAKARALASAKSADPEEQLDAKLRAMALGQAAYGDLPTLTKKVTGVELTNKEELAQVLGR